MRNFAKLAAIAVLTLIPALAHERAEAGDYLIIVGQVNEPALPGMVNGLDLIVRRKSDNTPVEGLERTLRVEITSPTGQKKVYAFSEDAKNPLRLRPQYGEDKKGRYTTTWILATPGQYQVRVFGTINNAPVDVTVAGGTWLMPNPADFQVR